MSIRIGGNYNDNYNSYNTKAEHLEKPGIEQDREPKRIPARQDEYVRSEKSSDASKEEPEVPSDVSEPKEKGRPKAKANSPEKSEEKCTGNTDKVDREIEKLKKKKKQLEQQINAASENEERVRELKKELAQVENELKQKDNDTYRRQHTSFFAAG